MSFDLYGRRLATCSSDRKIKIWEKEAQWQLQYEWTAHQASVWKVTWAHPEFGQIVASCSFDRTAIVWEESLAKPQTPLLSTDGSQAPAWALQAQLTDARESVHDVKFAPRHHGLRLATASADGYVRMYEASNPMNLSEWTLPESFLADSEGVTCLSWNSNRFDNPMILVGGNSNVAKVWGFTSARQWYVVAELVGHKDIIHDVCWAPNLGRSCHYLATASKDRTVRIWKLKLSSNREEMTEVKQVAMKDHGMFEVWRVQWNVTGTMLASSGDDGTVHMWQQDHQREWQCVSTISGDMSI
ncbi:nucleoporin [Thraustotheca clavata]|uniref:Nucleoporin n=1 Tax=Thraustotheca clavata TaxID=74557 RepID=A0A1V9ZBP2_9STRA|nr:nucleoporin [Thraustotheca clavata]